MDDYRSDLDGLLASTRRLTPEERAVVAESLRRVDPDASFKDGSFFVSTRATIDAYNTLVGFVNGDTAEFPGDEHAVVMGTIPPMLNLLCEAVHLAHRDYSEWWENPDDGDPPSIRMLLVVFPRLLRALEAVTMAGGSGDSNPR